MPGLLIRSMRKAACTCAQGSLATMSTQARHHEHTGFNQTLIQTMDHYLVTLSSNV